MAFAVIATGGKQYRVKPGDVIEVERLDGAQGSITFDDVLMLKGESQVRVGTPTVQGANVRGTVLGEVKGRKIRIFTYRAKKRRRRRMGHRQRYTRVRIDAIEEPAADTGAVRAEPAARPARAAEATAGPSAAEVKARVGAKSTAESKASAEARAEVEAAAKPKATSKARAKTNGAAKAKSAAKPKAAARPKAAAKSKATAKSRAKGKGSARAARGES